MSQPTAKIKDLKAVAFKLAQSLGLKCSTTAHLKNRGLTKGLDMRCKSCWLKLIVRLKDLKSGVVAPLLIKSQSIAA